MRTRSLLPAVLCSVLLLAAAGVCSAYSYNIVFCRYGPKTGMTTTFELWSPARVEGSPGTETFPAVNSKWNQPRGEGDTNPHQGCDLNMLQEWVYPLFRGWVDHVDTANGDLVLYLDLDGDGTRDDSAWANYKHLTQFQEGITEGATVLASTKLARSGGSPLHLHFGVQKSYVHSSNTGLWAPLERYYPQGWSAGQDLDFICTISQSSATVRATAYVKDDGTTEYLSPGDVKLWHRASDASPWQADTMTLVTGSSKRWEFNLAQVYSPGTTVRYMVIAQRTSIIPTYSWGIFPAKFAQPAADNPDENQAYDYLTITLPAR